MPVFFFCGEAVSLRTKSLLYSQPFGLQHTVGEGGGGRARREGSRSLSSRFRVSEWWTIMRWRGSQASFLFSHLFWGMRLSSGKKMSVQKKKKAGFAKGLVCAAARPLRIREE